MIDNPNYKNSSDIAVMKNLFIHKNPRKTDHQ
jgi:hypothetical protein